VWGGGGAGCLKLGPGLAAAGGGEVTLGGSSIKGNRSVCTGWSDRADRIWRAELGMVGDCCVRAAMELVLAVWSVPKGAGREFGGNDEII
jgi:hypothetical protein